MTRNFYLIFLRSNYKYYILLLAQRLIETGFAVIPANYNSGKMISRPSNVTQSIKIKEFPYL